mgnify:CR=1 FL=1
METEKKYLSISAAAKYLGKTRQGIHHMIKSGKLRLSNDVVGCNLVYADDVKFLKSMR